MPAIAIEELWSALGRVLDPEVPVLSVVDLGIVRDVRVAGEEVEVDITPTYSGCPAMETIQRDIEAELRSVGVERVRFRTVLSPAWTTDWLSDDARVRLREYGIAPPSRRSADDELVPLRRRQEAVPCPYCRSSRTDLRSEFGATACKAIYFCQECRQPFEWFKNH
jgi:ring-1,2-phenylacetyl-CoA epoxidase subunit PaaD